MAEGHAVELGIDSASTDASVAVMRDGAVLAERQWTLESTFSQELLAAVDATLGEAAVERTAITAIAVDAGPGGYTGLRTGVATAQGLAFALDVPLAGVSRLQADALPLLGGERPVVAVHDLGGTRGVAWAAYEPGGPVPIALLDPRIDTIQECVRLAPAEATWTGELTEELREALGGRADVTYVLTTAARASSVLRLARLLDAYTDPAEVDVIYLRPPHITAPSNPLRGRPGGAERGR